MKTFITVVSIMLTLICLDKVNEGFAKPFSTPRAS